MDVINLGNSRKFLRERPIRLKLIERPRLVSELVCLEPGQQDLKRTFETSDALYVVVEGHAQLRLGVQVQALEALDTVVVAPGVEHYLTNDGVAQLTALVVLSPNPLFDARRRFDDPGRDRPVGAAARPPSFPRRAAPARDLTFADERGEAETEAEVEDIDLDLVQGSEADDRYLVPPRPVAPYRNNRPGGDRPAPFRRPPFRDSRSFSQRPGPAGRPPYRDDRPPSARPSQDERPAASGRPPFRSGAAYGGRPRPTTGRPPFRQDGSPRRPRGGVAGAPPVDERGLRPPRRRPSGDSSQSERPPFRRSGPPRPGFGRPRDGDVGGPKPFRPGPPRSGPPREDRQPGGEAPRGRWTGAARTPARAPFRGSPPNRGAGNTRGGFGRPAGPAGRSSGANRSERGGDSRPPFRGPPRPQSRFGGPSAPGGEGGAEGRASRPAFRGPPGPRGGGGKTGPRGRQGPGRSGPRTSRPR